MLADDDHPANLVGLYQSVVALYETIDELPESIRDVVRCSDTLIMKNHGAVTLGRFLIDPNHQGGLPFSMCQS